MRAEVGLADDDPHLALYDPNANWRAMLAPRAGTPSLGLNDFKGNLRASLDLPGGSTGPLSC